MGEAIEQFGTTFRRAVLAALFVAAGSAAWAGGGAEKQLNIEVFKNGKINKTIMADVAYRGGTTVISVKLAGASHCVLKETSQDNTVKYRNPLANNPDTEIPAATASTLAGVPMVLEDGSAEIQSNSVIKAYYAIGEKPSRNYAPFAKGKNNAVTITWNSYGKKTDYELTWIIDKYVYRLVVEAEPEFVPGERKLFAKEGFANIAYEKKAYSLLAKIFPSGELEGKIKSYIAGNDGGYFTVFDALPASDTDLTTAVSAVKGAIARHFLFQEGDKTDEAYEIADPYKLLSIKMDKMAFEDVYGSTKNPYLSGYFLYLYELGKPALSYPAQEKLAKTFNVMYDWHQYRLLTAEEGTKVAKSALRYVTGAVEYDLFTTTVTDEAPTANGREYPVYRQNPDMINDWRNAGKNTNRSENYLPSGSAFNAIDGSSSLFQLKTPFLRLEPGTNEMEPSQGNPFPYAPYGIDTPRSFAYKMVEQLVSRGKLSAAAKALGANAHYKDNGAAISDTLASTAVDYTGGIDAAMLGRKYAEASEFLEPLKSQVKPFLPGAYRLGKTASKNTSESDYSPDQTAGVDSVGLLAGALSMVPELDSVSDAINRSIGGRIDAYSALGYEGAETEIKIPFVDGNVSGQKAEGLDADGKPAFNVTTETSRLKTTGATLTWSDLERTTVLIPDISMIHLGDLVCGRDGEGRPHVGVVVRIGWSSTNEAPAYGADASAWYNQVYVVSVRKGLRVATLGTWGNSGTTFGGFTQNPESYQIRRLVAFNAATLATTKPAKESWEAFDTSMSEIKAELTFKSYQDGWSDRWIPNTGEWMEIDKIEIKGKTVFGEDQNGGASFNIKIAAPLDAFADPNDTDSTSNIKNNKGEGIEIGGKSGNNQPYVWIARAKRNVTTGDYDMTYNTVYLTGDGIAKGTNSLKTTNGELLFNGNKLAVRPLVGQPVYPGDDFLLRFALADDPSMITTPEIKDRIAFFDKKLQWRANLYIQERANDWNDVHPWPAPASGNNGPAWWNSTWGYNEWNRTFTVPSAGINYDLVFGTPDVALSGKQVVSFSKFPWTPVRPKTSAGIANNYYDDTVAYDYPRDGDSIRAWDSPFDFIWKMNRQRRAIRDHFLQYTSELASQTAIFPNGLGGSITQTGKNSQFAGWPTTKAPHDEWKFYWKEPSGGIRAFIPGLGFRYYIGMDANSEPNTRPGVDLEFSDKASAGTDCIGFAQRAASYRNNKYSWKTFPYDRAEGNNDPDSDNRVNYQEYPKRVNKSSEIIARETISSTKDYFTETVDTPSGPTVEEFQRFQEIFKRITPGDIINYGQIANGVYSGEHIGVITRIDLEQMSTATNISDLMASLTIIESVYGGQQNHVFTRNMIQGNGATLTEGVAGSWYLDWTSVNAGGPLLRPWFIERLKVQ